MVNKLVIESSAIICSIILLSGFLSSYGAKPVSKGETLTSGRTNLLSSITKTLNDMTSSQAMQLGSVRDKISAYMQTVKLESNGNLTKMNELILDDMGPQGLLNEKEKQTILHLLKGLDQNATVANAPVLKKEVSSALTEAMHNSTNKNMIVITSLLNSSINKLQPIAGPNGVPILTVNDLVVTVPASVLLETGCALVGLSLFGGPGAALGAGICAAL
jgi:hypothetical protein